MRTIRVKIYNFGRDVNGNKIARHLVQQENGNDWEILFHPVRRLQVGSSGRCDDNVSHILKKMGITFPDDIAPAKVSGKDYTKDVVTFTFTIGE